MEKYPCPVHWGHVKDPLVVKINQDSPITACLIIESWFWHIKTQSSIHDYSLWRVQERLLSCSQKKKTFAPHPRKIAPLWIIVTKRRHPSGEAIRLHAWIAKISKQHALAQQLSVVPLLPLEQSWTNSRLNPRNVACLFGKFHIIVQKYITALAFSVTGPSLQQLWFAESNYSLETVAAKNVNYIKQG